MSALDRSLTYRTEYTLESSSSEARKLIRRLGWLRPYWEAKNACVDAQKNVQCGKRIDRSPEVSMRNQKILTAYMASS